MSLLLALDTATQYAAIALSRPGQILAEFNWRSQRRHTAELAYLVDRLCTLQDVTPAEIQAIAVTIGPGSYTGVRIALSYAKGLIAVRPLPLMAIPTLDCLAYAAPLASGPVCAMVAAGRRRFCWAMYQKDGSDIQRQSDWGLNTLPEIVEQLTQPAYFIGELTADDAAFLQQQTQQVAGIIPPALAMRRGAVLAELGQQARQRGAMADPVTLSPIYLG